MRTTTETPQSQSRPRSPGIVYGGIATAIVVLIGVIALTTRQPPPPTIAEFAPQAVEQIKDAPSEQTSEFGSGEGGAATGEASEPTAKPVRTARPAQAEVSVPRVRRCVGNPPRQIEDPQSPPCVPYWQGDNGGKTWPRGVTDKEIRIYVPTDDAGSDRTYPALFNFFNRRFEFYGRELFPVYGGTEPGSALKEDMENKAAQADDANVFASTRYRTGQGFWYHRELVRRKIPSVTGTEWGYTRSYLNAQRPYLLTYMPELEDMFGALGEWACKRLAGRKAVHAGDAQLRARDRRFGIILQPYTEGEETTVDPLTAELRRCGIEPDPVLVRPLRSDVESVNHAGGDPVLLTNTVAQMQTEGVTSIFCLCQPYAFGNLMKAAANQNYSPEWLISSYGNFDTPTGAIALGNAPPQQLAQGFGISHVPRLLPPANEPARWAQAEADPASRPGGNANNNWVRNNTYRGMLVLASAIQMAGPNLNPETFMRGIQRTTFPNPEHPNKPGRINYTPYRFGGLYEAAEFWWKLSSEGPYPTPDAVTVCYVDEAARYARGQWPSGDGELFDDPCYSGR